MDRRTFAFAALCAALSGPAAAAAEEDKGGDDRKDEQDRLRRLLRLSDEQQGKIRQLYRESDRRKREIDERLKKLYRDLDGLYDRYEFDRVRVRAVTDEITEWRRRSLTLYMDNEERLRGILRRDQFERLRDITRVRRGERRDKDDD